MITAQWHDPPPNRSSSSVPMRREASMRSQGISDSDRPMGREWNVKPQLDLDSASMVRVASDNLDIDQTHSQA